MECGGVTLQEALIAGAAVSRYSNREFLKTPNPSPPTSPESSLPTTDSSADKEEASRVEFNLAALHIHGEDDGTLCKLDSLSQRSDSNAAVTALPKKMAQGIAFVKARAAAMAIGEVDKARASETAARVKGPTRMERLTKEDIDFLIAKSKKPRPLLRVDHEFIDSLTFVTPEVREEMRAAKTMFVEGLQALWDHEKELIDKYHTDGYVDVEVEDYDSGDFEPWASWIGRKDA